MRQGRGRPRKGRDARLFPTLRELGISKQLSSDCQKLAVIPEAEFERRLAAAAAMKDPQKLTMAARVPKMLRRQVPGRSVTRSELPRAAATPTAATAPMKNRAAAISAQGRWLAPSRVHTFMAAKQSWARTIHPSPRRARSRGREPPGAGWRTAPPQGPLEKGPSSGGPKRSGVRGSMPNAEPRASAPRLDGHGRGRLP